LRNLKGSLGDPQPLWHDSNPTIPEPPETDVQKGDAHHKQQGDSVSTVPCHTLVRGPWPTGIKSAYFECHRHLVRPAQRTHEHWNHNKDVAAQTLENWPTIDVETTTALSLDHRESSFQKQRY
jgi:hypothetical protein